MFDDKKTKTRITDDGKIEDGHELRPVLTNTQRKVISLWRFGRHL